MVTSSKSSIISEILTIPVIVSALGYFVDIYDLILFSIVRVPSLKSFGLNGQELLDQGVFLLNMQMAGMLLGGIFWGILGDKKGRVKILFGSIFLYSIANFANGTVGSIWSYAAWRFIAGIGLAGELGAGITLSARKSAAKDQGIWHHGGRLSWCDRRDTGKFCVEVFCLEGRIFYRRRSGVNAPACPCQRV